MSPKYCADLHKNLIKILTRARRKQGISRRAIENKLGLQPGLLKAWEQGQVSPVAMDYHRTLTWLGASAAAEARCLLTEFSLLMYERRS
jgi:transcriptional regulator with XRE-family HTH domain